jgi:uracil-DNA glycosylase
MKISEKLGDGWFEQLAYEFHKPYMQALHNYIKRQRSKGITIYPASEQVFEAYRLTPFEEVKVCIVGQDPYIKPNEAHGLAFSTLGKSTPSLDKIKEALGSTTWDNNLTRWATQGVFLLNKVLTVEAGKSLSHQGLGWEKFTARTIHKLSQRGHVVFMLWGNEAQEYKEIIDSSKNSILTCEHPAAAAWKKRAWIHKECFKDANSILRALDKAEIQW